MQQTVNLSSLCKCKHQKMVVIVVKRYSVREAEKWPHAVRKAKIRQYAVRKGGGGCHPLCCEAFLKNILKAIVHGQKLWMFVSIDIQQRKIANV